MTKQKVGDPTFIKKILHVFVIIPISHLTIVAIYLLHSYKQYNSSPVNNVEPLSHLEYGIFH